MILSRSVCRQVFRAAIRSTLIPVHFTRTEQKYLEKFVVREFSTRRARPRPQSTFNRKKPNEQDYDGEPNDVQALKNLKNLIKEERSQEAQQYYYSLSLELQKNPDIHAEFVRSVITQQKYSSASAYPVSSFPHKLHVFEESPLPISIVDRPKRKIYNLYLLLLVYAILAAVWFKFMTEERTEQEGGAGGEEGQGGKAGGLIPKTGEVRRERNSKVRFKDVCGSGDVKEELQEIVEYLRNSEKYTKVGARLPKGVLLVGPPGTGKTLLARAIAGEAGAPFFYTSASEFDEVFVGVGAKRIRKLFAEAKKNAPAIIFIDEIDGIGPRSKFRTNETLMQLLSEMDGFEKHEGVVIIAATNNVQDLDQALQRPGRFDKKIYVPLPDIKGRAEILEYYLNKTRHAKNIDVLSLAKATIGMAGADIENLVNLAAIKAALENKACLDEEYLKRAFDDVKMGVARRSAVIPYDNLKVTAIHEGGHALVGLLTPNSKPIYKASIIPRGNSLGMVSKLVENEYSYSRQEMIADISTALGGRIAEELVFGKDNVTTGACSDFQKATHIAERMLRDYGMSKTVGLAAFASSDMSENSKRKLEDETREIIKTQTHHVKDLITRHNKELQLIAESLLKYESLTGDELKTIISTGRLLDRPILEKQ